MGDLYQLAFLKIKKKYETSQTNFTRKQAYIKAIASFMPIFGLPASDNTNTNFIFFKVPGSFAQTFYMSRDFMGISVISS